MALIMCPECNNQISDKAKVCIHCGFPLEDYVKTEDTTQEKAKLDENEKAKYWCRHCYRQNEIGQDYCAYCGERLTPLYEKEKISINNPSNSVVNNGEKESFQTSTPNSAEKKDSKIIMEGLLLLFMALGSLLLKVYFGAIFFGFLAYMCLFYKPSKKTNTITNNNNYKKKCCPRCGGTNFHAYVEDIVLRPEKVKSTTSLNLNPLKPFTIYNHKNKVVREAVTMQTSKFICDDCGKIFQ